MSRWLIIVGVFLILIGGILHFAPWLVNWFGRLPGDIRIENEQSRIFIPFTSMVMVSVFLTLIINIFSR